MFSRCRRGSLTSMHSALRTNGRQARTRAYLVAFLMAGALSFWGCKDHATEPRAAIDLESFRAMARTSQCADARNRLYLIDEILVFWDRAGSCADAAYALTLFGGAIDNQLCKFQDSIAGPMKGCSDSRFGSLFDTIIANADKPDLGLGPGHRVRAIPS